MNGCMGDLSSSCLYIDLVQLGAGNGDRLLPLVFDKCAGDVIVELWYVASDRENVEFEGFQEGEFLGWGVVVGFSVFGE